MNVQKRKNRFRTVVLWISLATVLVAGSAFTSDYFEISKNLEIFTSLYQKLNTYYVDETEPGELMKTGIDAMLKSLDPYTVYYPESKIEDYRFMTTGQYGGIGAIIRTSNGRVLIAEPHEGYAAAKAGLLAGDEIVKVDGRSVEGKNQSEMSEILKGQAGTDITITVNRPGMDQPQDFSFKREEVKIKDVPYYGMLDDQTGYVKLRKFTKTASSEVRAAMNDLKGQGMKRLVFDLRGNGGGLLREAVNIVNFFVPKGQEIVSTRGKLEEWNRTHAALNAPIAPDLPLVVLVNGGSASASEIVSGALQDLDRAVVIGERSFGKGLVQQTKDISFNSKLKLTVAKYYIPSGRCIQKLDYTNRSGSKVDEVADSLIKPFSTIGGRTVYDGRGIDPDVLVDLDDDINIIRGLITNDVIFDYATQYRLANQAIDSADTFTLSDDDYQRFVDFAEQRDFEYNTVTEKVFEDLQEIAAEERYYEGAEEEFAALLESITPEKSDDLMKFKKEITELLESEIASRYYFQTGRIKADLEGDVFISSAIETFDGSYNSLLDGTTDK